jgi:aminoacylase
MPLSEMDALLREWTSEEGVSFEFTYRTREHAVTSTDRRANPFWAAFEDCMAAQQLRVEAEVFPAGTDSRYLRRKGIPVFGFSPLARTPVLLHDHNERVNADTYMRGIAIYERVIPALANV